MRFIRRLLSLALLASLLPASASAISLEPIGGPSQPAYSAPVHVTSEPGDPNRLYVVEKAGEIELTTPQGTSTFLDITDRVSSGPQDEQGLLSIAFPSDYASTRLLYVFYVDIAGDLAIDEFRAAAGGDTADLSSRRNVVTIPHPGATNHNGGQLQFGPDGFLYAAPGDGGAGGGDPAQDLTSLLGKVIRIDPRDPPGAPDYAIPADNPFAGTSGEPAGGIRDEIWSYGLRNPWRFSFDRATGALTIGDVGEASWEEVNYSPAELGAGRAANFGWNCREGAHVFQTGGGCATPFIAPTDPIFEYPNPPAGCASITGGYVARDPEIPELAGRYIYADLCSGAVRSLVPAAGGATGDAPTGIAAERPTSFGEDACGRLYLAEIGGTVSRITGSLSGDPATCDVPAPDAAKDASAVTTRAGKRRVGRGRRVTVRVEVEPCGERAGALVSLRRGQKPPFAEGTLSARCTERFRPKVRKRTRFVAALAEGATYLGDSDAVKVRLKRAPRR